MSGKIESPSWTTKKVKVKDLKAFEKNPRKITPKEMDSLKRSIAEDGYHQRILCTTDLRIIGGHQRIQAMLELGYAEVEVLVPDREISDEQFSRILVRDNMEYGTWNIDGLGELMPTAQLMEIGLGDNIINKIPQDIVAGNTDPDEVPEPPKEPLSAYGDVWQLGDHRLMCGDATRAEDMQKLMGSDEADMVFTDPPYRMSAEGGSAQPIGRAAAKLGEAIKHMCDFDPPAFLAMLKTVFSRGKMNAYVFCNKDLVPDYLNWAIKSGYAFNILFWKKPNAIPLGEQHRPDLEYLLFFRKNAPWNNAVKEASYSKCLEYARENSTPHPTMKPVALIENELLISSHHGSIVLDMFGGSGSTLMACERLGRVARIMELDAKYVDVIIKRWENYSGKQAVRA